MKFLITTLSILIFIACGSEEKNLRNHKNQPDNVSQQSAMLNGDQEGSPMYNETGPINPFEPTRYDDNVIDAESMDPVFTEMAEKMREWNDCLEENNHDWDYCQAMTQ